MSSTDAWANLEDPARSLGSARWEAARLASHWAAQLAAAPGASLSEPAADFAHLSLTWLAPRGVLAGPRLSAAGGARAALRVRDLNLLVLDAADAERAALALEGQTLDEARGWLAEVLASGPLDLPRERPGAHPVADGAAFGAPDREALSMLERGFVNAAGLLKQLTGELPGSGPVRLWPHHFDMASLQALSDASGEDAPSLGFGFSPGDAGYREPYWYVLPWPAPSGVPLGSLESGGIWHEEGWIGAVLTSSAVAALGERQREGVRAFLRSARDAGREALSAQRERS